MAEIEVPPYFLCPISLEIMEDPVTISTGITYDRDSIEKWIFSHKNHICPVTKQPLSDTGSTPNVTLRRLIQSWCTLHAGEGVQRLPTPKPPATKPELLKLLTTANANPETQLRCLQRLRDIASHNQTNRRCMEEAGAASFLASLIVNKTLREDSSESSIKSREDALSILYSIQLSESGLKSLASMPNFMDCLIVFMQSMSYESQTYAVLMLKSMAAEADPAQLVNFPLQLFMELGQILRNQICRKATKASLQLLTRICPFGRNRIKAVEAGIVGMLIDFLLDTDDKRVAEMMLAVLDLCCQCAEGRAALLGHGAGLAVVSKKILRVGHGGSERAVRILYSVSKFSATTAVLQEMLQMGVVAKLCLVLQIDCGVKMKERAREILKMHARVWKHSSCIPNTLISAYPS